MKRFVTLILLMVMVTSMVSAQETTRKPIFDAMNRIIRDGNGKRIVYDDSSLPNKGLVRNKSMHGAGPVNSRMSRGNDQDEGLSTIAICAPQWIQATMGSCIGLNSMITEDIDHDGKTEIVCGAGVGFGAGLYWYVMKYNEASQDYEQIWMSSPIDVSNGDPRFSCIRAFDIDNDNIFEIFVGYENGLVEIYKGAGMDLIRSFSSGGTEINDILFADADNDGQKEVVLCADYRTYLFNSSSFTNENTIPYGSYRCAVGNVDADTRNEIVYSNGTIVDLNGSSLSVEWNIFTPAIDNALVALTDTDGDGRDEVIIAKAWYSIEVYDADLKALKGTINSDLDIDAMIVADVNGDSKKEILYGDGQWGDVYCFNSLTLQKMWSIPNPEHGVTQMAVADADSDGQLELLWGSGCSSTGADYLYIHNIANQAFEFRSKDYSGPFYDVETGDVDGDGQDEIVTVSFESRQGYDSGILSVFDGATGDLEWQCDGNFFPFTWMGIHTLELANITGDATKEIIVGTDRLYDGAIYIVSGVTHQIITSKIFTSEGISEILGLAVADVDVDGTAELVVADNTNLFVVNPSSFAIEWTSPPVSGYGVRSVKTGNLDSDPNPEMVVCKGYVTVYDGITHEQWLSPESNCTNIDLYDWDGDGIQEIIACTSNGKILMMDRQTNLTSVLFDAGGMQIDGVRVVNLDGTGLAEFVFTSGGKIYFANSAGDMLSTGGFGPEAGSYDALKLSDINNDGILEIFAGTRYQVVQVSEECSQCLGFKVVASGTNASCVPGTDGTAAAVISAGTAPFAFQWSNGINQQSISGLAPGYYTVHVTDSKGCPAQDTVIIAQSHIGATIYAKNVGCYGVQDGAASIVILTGTPPYQYVWNNGGTQQAIIGVAPGTYNCSVTDHMGCFVSKSIAILKDTVRINLTTEDPKCFGDGGQGMVQVLSGTPPFVYLWGGIQGSSINYNLQPGNYILTVRDTLNCSALKLFTITEPSQIILTTSIVPDDPGTIAPDGQASVIATGGTPPYYYQWNDPFHQTNSTATNLAKGHYEVYVNDYAGCNQTIVVDLYGLAIEGAGKKQFSLNVFPNPASDVLHVAAEFSHPVSGIAELVNTMGDIIYSRQFQDHDAVNFKFDLAGLPASIYLVVLHSGEGTLTRRVIINR